MGGGLSLTFPGYHIFASGIIMMTGMPDYIAQAVIAALFSSLIVLCAYLITKSVWIESGALIVAFLVAVSRPDMEILLWGGYPNVITLLLIPVTFYLYLQKDRFTLAPFLVSTSILVGSIYLTHSLSAAVFVATTVATVLFVMISPKTFGTSRKHVFYWLLPLVLGAVLVAPFLVNAVPAYLSANSSFVEYLCHQLSTPINKGASSYLNIAAFRLYVFVLFLIKRIQRTISFASSFFAFYVVANSHGPNSGFPIWALYRLQSVSLLPCFTCIDTYRYVHRTRLLFLCKHNR